MGRVWGRQGAARPRQEALQERVHREEGMRGVRRGEGRGQGQPVAVGRRWGRDEGVDQGQSQGRAVGLWSQGRLDEDGAPYPWGARGRRQGEGMDGDERRAGLWGRDGRIPAPLGVLGQWKAHRKGIRAVGRA